MPPTLLGIPTRFLAMLVGVGIVVAAILYFGHSRYEAGVRATDEKWVAAGERLKEQARAAAGHADAASIRRQDDYQRTLEDEKERLDEAEQNGSSPFDVLFGGGQ